MAMMVNAEGVRKNIPDFLIGAFQSNGWKLDNRVMNLPLHFGDIPIELLNGLPPFSSANNMEEARRRLAAAQVEIEFKRFQAIIEEAKQRAEAAARLIDNRGGSRIPLPDRLDDVTVNVPKLASINGRTLPIHNARVAAIKPTGEYDKQGNRIFNIRYEGEADPRFNPFGSVTNYQDRMAWDSDTKSFIKPDLRTLDDPTEADVEFNTTLDDERVARIFAQASTGTLYTAEELIPALSHERNFLDPIDPTRNVLQALEALGMSRESADALIEEGLTLGVLTLPTSEGISDEVLPTDEDDLQAWLDEFFGGFGGGGGGSPEFVPPDKRLVADNVRGLLRMMVGKVDESRVRSLTNAYLDAARKQFNGESIDPLQEVKERIRTFKDYKAIHELRPDGSDELQWIPSQHASLARAGVRPGVLDERSITQAQVGVLPGSAGEAAQLFELQNTGRAMPDFFRQMQDTAARGFRRVL